MRAENETVMLVDGQFFMHKYYHGLASRGDPSSDPRGAVRLFMHFLLKHIPKFSYLLVAMDTGPDDNSQPSQRQKVLRQYKQQRSSCPQELKHQLTLLSEACEVMDIRCLHDDNGYEADDIIGTYCQSVKSECAKVHIFSGDKDLMQLVSKNVIFRDGHKKDVALYKKNVKERMGVNPFQIQDLLALAGDHVDNIPGVPGFGKKRASKLLRVHKNLEGIREEVRNNGRFYGIGPKLLQNLSDHIEEAIDVRNKVTKLQNVNMQCSLEELKTPHQQPAWNTKVRDFWERQEFGNVPKILKTST